jgi:DNA repair protein RadC
MNLERKFFIVSEPTEFYSVLINSEEASERYIRSIIKQDKIDVFVKEYFYVIGLKTNNETNGYMKISDGGIDKTIIEITHIAKFLINNNCTKYILFHNHPSGNLKESTIDINITNQIKIAMDLFQIRILDHIIIAGDNYLSFVNKGLL